MQPADPSLFFQTLLHHFILHIFYVAAQLPYPSICLLLLLLLLLLFLFFFS